MRSIDGEVVQRKRCPSYNLSVSLRLDSSPGRGAFGIEEREVSKFMDSEKVIKRDNDYVLHTYNRNPIALEKGHGLYAEGPEGQKYLDFTSGIGVNSLGYCDVDWAEAVSEQAHKLQHTSNLYYTAPCGKLAKKLCKRTGMNKVFFGNSGAEANEGAIKAARKYSFDHYGKGRDVVITLVNSFHGRTIATLTATGQEVFHNYFGPFNEGFQYVPAGDLEAPVSYTHLRAHETDSYLVCRLLLEKKKKPTRRTPISYADFCLKKKTTKKKKKRKHT